MTAIRSMAALNRTAAELMINHSAHAATDITGYGLLGHAYEMASGSNVSIRIDAQSLPLLPDVLMLAELGMIPGGANDNRAYLQSFVSVASSVDKHLEAVMYDPQTSGGLFIALPESHADAFQNDASSTGLLAARIGRVEPLSSKHLLVD